MPLIMGNKLNEVTEDTMDTDSHNKVTELQTDKIYSLAGECLFEGTFAVKTTASNERIEIELDLRDDSVDTEKTSQNIAITENVQTFNDLQSNKICSHGAEYVGDPCKADGNETAGVVIDLTQNSVDTEEASEDATNKTSQEDTMDMDGHKDTGIQSSKMCYEIKIDFSENPCKVENNETTTGLIDFEEIIDMARDFIETNTSIPYIQEFERVLSSFPTAGTSNTNANEILSLDEVDELFENLVTESSSLYSQTLHNVQDSEHTTVKIDEKLDINANKTGTTEEIESQSNDAGTHTITTTVGVDKDDVYLTTSIEETESIDSDGYNSSDFEFITEDEAKMDGFIINFTRNDACYQKYDTNNKIKHHHSYNNYIEYYDFNDNPQIYDERHAYDNVYDPGEGPSGLNGAIEDYDSRSYRANHHVPDEEGYLNLFQGQNPALPMADIIFLENKSVRPSPMNLQYEGIGFVHQLIRRQCQPDSSDEEYADEAKECMQKILFMYPNENRKPKKRRRY